MNPWAKPPQVVVCCSPCHCRRKKRKNKVIRVVTYRFNNASFTAKGDNMSLVLKDVDLPGTVDVTVSFVNAKGKPASVDGAPTWTASDTTVIDSVTVAADGMSAKLHITDTIGVSQLTVNADVDLGSGVNNKDFVDTISVIAGEATSASFSFGTVTPDTGTPPASLQSSYADNASFMAAVGAYTGPEQVMLDGIEVKAGTAPALLYFSHSADGSVNTTGPTD